VLELRDYFNGTLDAYGIFTDRSGKVVKRFTVVMVASGRATRACWTKPLPIPTAAPSGACGGSSAMPDGRYSGQADDVVGDAQGQQSGNAFHWTYTLALPVDGRVIEVQFDDWMYLMNDKVMLNKAAMRKWGVGLGEVTLSFFKR
jgi:hypothetical protein